MVKLLVPLSVEVPPCVCLGHRELRLQKPCPVLSPHEVKYTIVSVKMHCLVWPWVWDLF